MSAAHPRKLMLAQLLDFSSVLDTSRRDGILAPIKIMKLSRVILTHKNSTQYGFVHVYLCIDPYSG